MGSDDSHFNVSVGSDGQSHRTVSTNHNLLEEKRGPSAYQPHALPLGQTGSHPVLLLTLVIYCRSAYPLDCPPTPPPPPTTTTPHSCPVRPSVNQTKFKRTGKLARTFTPRAQVSVTSESGQLVGAVDTRERTDSPCHQSDRPVNTPPLSSSPTRLPSSHLMGRQAQAQERS